MPSVPNLVLFTLKLLIADAIPSHLFIFTCSLALLAVVATFLIRYAEVVASISDHRSPFA